MPSLRNWRKKRVTESNDKKVPALRFKGFTDDWEQRKFESLIYPEKIKNKNNLQLRAYSISNKNGFIAQTDQFGKDNTYSKADKKTNYIVNPGAFAYNPARINVGSIGYQNLATPVLVSSLYEVFKTNSQIKDLFLIYWFKTDKFFNQIKKYEEGGVRQYYFLDKLLFSEIIIPKDVREQQKISKILKKLDYLISLQQRKLSLIKTLKRSFLSDLFFKTSTNSIVITLKQVTSIRGGYAFKSKEFTENGYPIIKIANISNNGEIKGPYSYTNNFNKKYILTKNDIVLAMSGATTGKIAKLRSSKAFLQNQRIGYFCKTNNIDYNYLYYLLISDQFKKQLKRITIAGAQPNVSSSDIENFRFSVLSSKNKQKKISDFLNKLDTKIRITNKKITIFSQLKRSLLNNMFI